MRALALQAALALLFFVAACGDNDGASAVGTEPTTTDEVATTEPAASTGGEVEELYPDVVDASAEQADDGTWTFSVTLSSPYDTPERYADAWRVVGPDGEVFGERILLHDHANEQPFTRSQSGIEVPDGVNEVTIEGRDQVSGWGGQTLVFQLPG